MIGTVFFLAFIAPFTAAQYPATTAYAPVATNPAAVYPEPSYETTARYEPSYPESTTKTSYPASNTESSYPASNTESSYPASNTESSYPVSNTESSYPASNTESSYPASNTESSYPASNTESSYYEPTDERSYSEPTSKPSYSEPTSEKRYSEPTSEDNYIESGSEESYHEPTSKPSYYPPTTESSYAQPTSDESYHEPTSKPSYYPPTTESSYAQPTSDESYHEPTSKPSYYPSTTKSSYPEPTSDERYQEPTSKPSPPSPTYETGYDNSETYGNEYNHDSYNGPYNSHFDMFPHFPISPGRNIRQDLDDDLARVSSVLKHDRIQETDLDIIESKVNQSTKFREGFEEIYEHLVASVDAQDRKIEKYRAQINALSSVSEDVTSLNLEFNLLISKLRNIRTRNEATFAIINQLITSNGAQDLGIVVVADQAEGNDQLNEIINTTRSSNLHRNAAVVKQLTQVVAETNREQAYSFIVTLTEHNKSVHINYENSFSRAPQLVWSIIGLDIEEIDNRSSSYGNNAYRPGSSGNNEYRSESTGNNEYRSGSTGNNEYRSGSPGNDEYRSGSTTRTDENRSANYDESINPRVTASGDAKGVTVRHEDGSKGWRTKEVRVQVFAFDINNDQSSSGENRNTTPKGGYSAEEKSYVTREVEYSTEKESYSTPEERYPRES